MPTRDIPARPWVRMGVFVFFAVTLLMTAWEWKARTRIGLRAGDIGDSPQAWAEARRAADHARGCDRRRQPHSVRHRPGAVRGADRGAAGAGIPCWNQRPRPARPFRQRPEFSRTADRRDGRHDVFRDAGDRPGRRRGPQLRQKRQAVATDRPVARPLAPELSRIHGRRLPVEPDAAEMGSWLAQGRRQSVRGRVENLRDVSRSAISHVGSDREPPICAAMRAMPGTGSRARMFRRRSPPG